MLEKRIIRFAYNSNLLSTELKEIKLIRKIIKHSIVSESNSIAFQQTWKQIHRALKNKLI